MQGDLGYRYSHVPRWYAGVLAHVLTIFSIIGIESQPPATAAVVRPGGRHATPTPPVLHVLMGLSKIF
jgi:hypothetical protein